MTVQKSGPFVYSIMFHKYRPSAKKTGSTCHKDIMAIGKHFYCLMLVEDFSAPSVAYSMQKWSHVLKCCARFAEKAWDHIGPSITFLKYDNAQEYDGTQGTVLQNNSDYTPGLNETGK